MNNAKILNLQMGTILQQSVLKGRQRITNRKEKNLLHELFTQTAVNYSNQLAIYYKGIYQSYY